MSDNKVLIIAEAGVNHNGSISRAIKLIEAAAEAGADIVKFQTFKAEKLVSKAAQKAAYQLTTTGTEDNSQFAMLKALELSHEDHLTLIETCQKNNIQFLSTAFDTDGIDYLNELGIPFFKSPSGELTNYPYLVKLANTGKPVILSTGMATIDEIRQAAEVLYAHGLPKHELTVLHCNTEYPTPYSDVNLKAMLHIQQELGVKVGYSDHTMGIEIPVAAVALGACVIEKHFTLDRALPGPDHKASLEPNELKQMVDSIRKVEQAISGNGKKEPSESEKKNTEIARKSLHYTASLHKGHTIGPNDLIPLRPAKGISPMKWNEIIGMTLNADVEAHQMVKESDFYS